MNYRNPAIAKSNRPTVGLLGLGIIGSRIAAKLRAEGVPLFVWSRSPRSEPNFLSSPTEVAELADILQIFVVDGPALMEVLRKASPALTAKHIVINHATISPEEAIEASLIVEKRGAQFLNAPFTGSRDAAAAGKLVYFIGGSEKTFEQVRPILEIAAEKILLIGSIEASAYVKIATNLILAAQVEILAEALEFLYLGKVPLQRLNEALQYSVGNSGAIAMKFPQMVQGEFEPRFSTKNMLKDLQFALTIAEKHQVQLPATTATASVLRAVGEAGMADADYSSVAIQYDYPGKEEYIELFRTVPRKKEEKRCSRIHTFLSRSKKVLKFFLNA